MKRIRPVYQSVWLAVCILFGLSCFSAYGAERTQPIAPGEALPQFKLEAPSSLEYREYLGLEGLEALSVTQIRAKLILIEILNVL